MEAKVAATQKQYTAAANSILVILKAEINAEVPSWAQGMIPPDLAEQLCGPLAKAAVDAALAVPSSTIVATSTD
jgi:hypothetical protein